MKSIVKCKITFKPFMKVNDTSYVHRHLRSLTKYSKQIFKFINHKPNETLKDEVNSLVKYLSKDGISVNYKHTTIISKQSKKLTFKNENPILSKYSIPITFVNVKDKVHSNSYSNNKTISKFTGNTNNHSLIKITHVIGDNRNNIIQKKEIKVKFKPVQYLKSIYKVEKVINDKSPYIRFYGSTFAIPNILANYDDTCNIGEGLGTDYIIIYKELGSYGIVFELPENTDIEIVNIYRLPYGLNYDKKKIYGRIVFNKPYLLDVNLNNGNKLRLLIKPTLTEIYEF